MVKRASWLKTALYVKCCSVSLMHAYGGCWDRHESLPHPISLARLERPRVIRNFHRRLIRRHDVRADGLVKMYLSMFSVSKLILVPKQSNYQYPQKIIRVGRLFGLGRLKVASDEDRPPRVPPVKIAELPSDSFNNERQKASNGNLCLCLCPSSYGSKLGHTKEGKVACRIWLKDKRLSNREELLDLPTHDDMRFKTPLNNVKAADPDYFLDPSSGMKDGQPNYLEEREEFSIDRGTRDIPVARKDIDACTLGGPSLVVGLKVKFRLSAEDFGSLDPTGRRLVKLDLFHHTPKADRSLLLNAVGGSGINIADPDHRRALNEVPYLPPDPAAKEIARCELGYLPFHVAVLCEKPGPAPKARSFYTSSFSVRSELAWLEASYLRLSAGMVSKYNASFLPTLRMLGLLLVGLSSDFMLSRSYLAGVQPGHRAQGRVVRISDYGKNHSARTAQKREMLRSGLELDMRCHSGPALDVQHSARFFSKWSLVSQGTDCPKAKSPFMVEVLSFQLRMPTFLKRLELGYPRRRQRRVSQARLDARDLLPPVLLAASKLRHWTNSFRHVKALVQKFFLSLRDSLRYRFGNEGLLLRSKAYLRQGL
uniref:Uncharacterized protein n=1 Tax=Fagus sylvatica TaxID=28930 RepID=A0A2N9GHK6_FAGSY